MHEIRYVCVSDTHFGAVNSVLTNLGSGDNRVDATKPSLLLQALCECLRWLFRQSGGERRPQLILNGDILELALSPDNQAVMAFERFLEIAMPPDQNDWLFDPQIIYIPGNHDHHVWEVTREKQYADFIKQPACKLYVPPPWHNTKLIEKRVLLPASLVEAIISRVSWLNGKLSVDTFYPNFALNALDGSRMIVFHHGHFTEEIYTLMSTLADLTFPDRVRANTPYSLEEENFAWIDFFWSALGRSGDVGEDVERIYESLQDSEALAEIAGAFLRGALKKWGKGPFSWNSVGKLTSSLVKALLRGKTERSKPQSVLSDRGVGMRDYLSTRIRRQFECEAIDVSNLSEMAFVFGHTHKPFEQMMEFDDYVVPAVSIYNSGGWVVDSSEVQPLFGGAVVLISEELETASLRMFNQARDAQGYSVQVGAAGPIGKNPFSERIRELVRSEQDPWKSFSATAATQVQDYRDRIAADLAQIDGRPRSRQPSGSR